MYPLSDVDLARPMKLRLYAETLEAAKKQHHGIEEK